MTDESANVLVVGGGAIGVCVAHELVRRGTNVTLVERGHELAAGCSAGSSGLLCPSHSMPLATPRSLRDGLVWMMRRDSPFYLKPRARIVPWLARFALAALRGDVPGATRFLRTLSQAGLALHAELADQGLETGFGRRGVLNVYETESRFDMAKQEAAEHARAGLEVEVLSADEARRLEPALGETLRGAVFFPQEAHCDSLRFVQAVGAEAERLGADVRLGVEVIGFSRRDGRVESVATTAGRLRPGTIVLAAGSWTPLLARELGAFVPLEGAKGYHIDFEAADGDPRIPIWMQESRVIATPLAGRLRLAGTLELAGLDFRVDPVRVDALVVSARRNLRWPLGRPVLEVWRGLRPMPPDGLPIVGRPDGLTNVVLATGHGMMGLTLAPITGRLVGQLLAGEPPSHDLRPLDPNRFRRLLSR